MPSEYAKQCWIMGVPLSEAWTEFAPPELADNFAQLPNFSEAMIAGFNPEKPETAFSSIGNALKAKTERDRLEFEMREYLLTSLFNGELIAVGYRETPTRSQSPVRIANESFDTNAPNWRDETFFAHGIRFGRIRICDPGALPPQKSKIRGSRIAIDQAIDGLMKSNSEFCNLHRQEAAKLVRAHLGIEEKPGNGLSDQNLAKAIVRKCGPKGISAK